MSESMMLGSSPCSHRRSVSLPTGTSLPAVILALFKRPRVVPVQGIPSGASDFTSGLPEASRCSFFQFFDYFQTPCEFRYANRLTVADLLQRVLTHPSA